MKKINYCIESFVETYNGVIQILLLALVVFANCLIVRFGQSQGGGNDTSFLFEIIIALIIGITLELILLHIKDSAAQRKIDGIGEVVRELAKREELWSEEVDLTSFFNATQHEFFISGMINDTLMHKYLYSITDLLDKGIKVKILIESFDQLEAAAKFLYGRDYEKSSLDLLRSKLNDTLKYLHSLERIENYFSKELLEIGLSRAPFVNPSIIAYDYTKGIVFETRRIELNVAPEMAVRFYIQGIEGPTSKIKTHPTLLINSNIMAKQYDDLVEVIENIWKFSDHIKTMEDFNYLIDKVASQLKVDNGKS